MPELTLSPSQGSLNSATGVLKETDKELSSCWRDVRGLLADISRLFFMYRNRWPMILHYQNAKDRLFKDGFDSGKWFYAKRRQNWTLYCTLSVTGIKNYIDLTNYLRNSWVQYKWEKILSCASTYIYTYIRMFVCTSFHQHKLIFITMLGEKAKVCTKGTWQSLFLYCIYSTAY